MDNNHSHGVFYFVAAISFLSVLTVLVIPKRRTHAAAQF